MREKAWREGKIVWIATFGKHIARITSATHNYPGWIYENAQRVKWKVIEGEEWL